MNKTFHVLTCLILLACAATEGAPLSPDDASISDSLCLWLRSPDINYDPATGVWTDLSGRGNDAVAVGTVAAYGITYTGPTAAFGKNPGVFDNDIAAVKFSGDADDLMCAPTLNDGVALSELTVVIVYRDYEYDESNRSITRPAGFGSISGEALNMGDNFNLANDMSIRKDNGSVTGATVSVPEDQFFIRAARMNPDAINQWVNTDGTFTQVQDVTNSSYVLSTDNFYLGDLRAGTTSTIGTSFSRTDIEIAEVVVYSAALTDAQIQGIGEWLTANVRHERKPAFAPKPADGAMDVVTPLLQWTAGPTAIFHKVYFGTSPDLTEADVVSPMSPVNLYFHPGGLVPGTWYYWRVDEIEADTTTIHEGNVWSFLAQPTTAYLPSPADGAATVWPTATLQWQAGTGAISQQLYFGEDFDLVGQGAAETDSGVPEESAFDPNGLAEGTRYFWRVDETNVEGVAAGEVWSFTTVIPIEEFESYTDNIDAGEAVFQTWIDGLENGTSSVVGYFESANGTFGETVLVHGGGQSMPFDYNNINSPFYSETERTFAPTENWTASGANTLILNVLGQASNGTAPLYVVLQDSSNQSGKVVHPNPTVVRSRDWVQWQIPFATFTDAGVNMAAVEKMVIGVGDPDAPVAGPTGLLFIDDMALAITPPAE